MAASGWAGLLALSAFRRAYDQVAPAIAKRARETASNATPSMTLSVPMVIVNFFLWLPALAIVSPPPGHAALPAPRTLTDGG